MVHAILAALQWVDVQAYYLVSRLHGNWFLDRLASLLEGNLLLKSGPILCVLWYFWFLDDEKQEHRRSLIIAILAGTFFGLLVSRSLALLLPYRMRPIYDAQLVVHRYLLLLLTRYSAGVRSQVIMRHTSRQSESGSFIFAASWPFLLCPI